MMKKRAQVKKEISRIAVWLDHTGAVLYKPGSSTGSTRITSGLESRIRIPGETADGIRLGRYRSTNNEAHKHNRRQNSLRAYYKKIADSLKPYDEISVAGPATASRELFNFLSAHRSFKTRNLFLRKGSSRAPKVAGTG